MIWICFFLGILILLPLAFGFVQLIRSFYDQTVGQKRQWQVLAKPNNLTFRTGHIGSRTDVSGVYRGYALTLDSLCDGNRHFTRIRIKQNTAPLRRKAPVIPVARGEIVRVLRPYSLRRSLRGSIQSEPGGSEIIYLQPEIETDALYLQTMFELLADIADVYAGIVALGGEAVEPLSKIAVGETKGLRPVASQLLRDIGTTTLPKLPTETISQFCPQCLTRFSIQQISLTPTKTVSFYGCRQCQQSRQHLTGRLIAVLDQTMTTAIREEPGQIQVNWLRRWRLFDFDSVAVGQVSEHEIERFVRLISRGYDRSNPYRFRGMTCYLQPDCTISPRSLQLLKRVFGYVVNDATEATLLTKRLTLYR